MAPTCYLEQPICDSRLMNEALADRPEAALLYRKWMVNSDAGRDPQAFIIGLLERSLEALPDNEAEFTRQMMAELDTSRFVAADYDLS